MVTKGHVFKIHVHVRDDFKKSSHLNKINSLDDK